MSALDDVRDLERQIAAMRLFVERVTERGDVAVTELEDLVVLQALLIVARAVLRSRQERGK